MPDCVSPNVTILMQCGLHQRHRGSKTFPLARSHQCEARGTQGSMKNCTSRESASPLSRLSRGFRDKIIDPPLGGIMRLA